MKKTAYCGHPSYHDTHFCTDPLCGNHHAELDFSNELTRLRAELSAARSVIERLRGFIWGIPCTCSEFHDCDRCQTLDATAAARQGEER